MPRPPSSISSAISSIPELEPHHPAAALSVLRRPRARGGAGRAGLDRAAPRAPAEGRASGVCGQSQLQSRRARHHVAAAAQVAAQTAPRRGHGLFLLEWLARLVRHNNVGIIPVKRDSGKEAATRSRSRKRRSTAARSRSSSRKDRAASPWRCKPSRRASGILPARGRKRRSCRCSCMGSARPLTASSPMPRFVSELEAAMAALAAQEKLPLWE